jgi:hypothetical protein
MFESAESTKKLHASKTKKCESEKAKNKLSRNEKVATNSTSILCLTKIVAKQSRITKIENQTIGKIQTLVSGIITAR